MHAEPVRPCQSPRRTRAVILAAVPALVAFALVPATLARAQSVAATVAAHSPSKPPAFSAVSVRPFTPKGPWHRSPQVDPQRLYIEGMSPLEMIQYAYGLNSNQIVGFPPWAGFGQFFQVTGTTSRPTSEAHMHLMLRRVLVDRFQLRYTVTDKMQPVYALVVAPGGPKLQPATSASDCTNGTYNRPQILSARLPPHFAVVFDNCTIAALVKRMNINNPNMPGLPVIDKTGLTGRYIMLVWERMAASRRSPGIYQPVETFRNAVKRELGLELVKTTAPYRVIHITRIEPPTPN